MTGIFGVDIPTIVVALGAFGLIAGFWISVFIFFLFTQVGGLWPSRTLKLSVMSIVLTVLLGLLGMYAGLLILNPVAWWPWLLLIVALTPAVPFVIPKLIASV